MPVPLLHHAAEAHLEVHLLPAAVVVEDVAAGEGDERLIAVEQDGTTVARAKENSTTSVGWT